MTTLQKLQKREAEIKLRLTELGELADADFAAAEVEHDALTSEYKRTQKRMSAAIVVADEATAADEALFSEDGESAEVRQLTGKASVVSILDARIQQRAMGGPEHELQAAYQLTDQHIPAALLGAPGRVQERASGVTIVGDTQGNQQPTLPAVWQTPTAMMLNLQRVSVPVGTSIWPVVTTSANVAAEVADDTAATEQAIELTTYDLSPDRIQTAVRWTRKQGMTAPNLESDIRQNLRESLEVGLDKYALTDANGIYSVGADPGSEGTPVSYGDFLSAITSTLDARYVNSFGSVKMLTGTRAFRLMPTTYGGPATNEESALAWLRRESGGVMATAFAPYTGSDKNEEAIVVKGAMRHAVMPVWDSVEVTDIYTGAGKGEVVLNVAVYTQIQVLRAAGYSRLAFRTAL